MPEAQVTARTEEQSTAFATPEVVQTAHERFGNPKNFINRELSWLEFDRRVLEEAQDPRQPLIERVKFLTIVSSNLDEFFEIRVAGIKQQIESETSGVGPDGLSPTEVFDRIQKTVRELVRPNVHFGRMSCSRSWRRKRSTSAKSGSYLRNEQRGRIVIFNKKFFQC